VRPSDCRPALRELASNVADQREHGTTGEVPIERFRRAEARALRPIAGVPPFAMAFELVRKVQADCVIGVDGNAYSVRWRLIGESVRVVISGDQLRISHAGREVAVHRRRTGRFQYCRPAPLRRSSAPARGRVPRLRLFRTPSPHLSCCARCSNISGWSEGAILDNRFFRE
jgi:Mu transposase-like protein